MKAKWTPAIFILMGLVMLVVTSYLNGTADLSGEFPQGKEARLDVYPLKGMVSPGEDVPIKIRVGLPASDIAIDVNDPAKLRLIFTRLFERIAVTTITLPADINRTPNFREWVFLWKAPDTPCEAGYGLEAELLDNQGGIIGRGWTAIDVGRDWTRKPRYGFLSDFGPDQVGQKERFEWMSKFHLNGLQFYDWMYRHSDYLPPAEEYHDPLNRLLSRRALLDKIRTAHEYGMSAMAYTAVYGAPVDFYRRHPDWALYRDSGDPVKLGENFLIIMNPEKGSPWRHYLLNEFQKIMRTLPFDGIHLDQYGDPKYALAYPPEKNRGVDLAGEMASLIDETKKVADAVHPGAKVIFNNVGNWPLQDTARSKVDVVYIEVWPPYRFFQHLKDLIDGGRKESGGKAVVLAAYISPEFIPSVLLTDATIFACGGYHLELGEGTGMLSEPYFPKYSPISQDLEDRLRRYYDLIVRYQELLFAPDLKEIDPLSVEIDGVKTLAGGYFDGVWPIVKEKSDCEIVHLINLLGLESAEWNAPRHEGPRFLKEVCVRIRTPVRPRQVYFISPDSEDLSARSLAFEYANGVVTVRIPGLKYWDLIVLQKPELEQTSLNVN